MCAGVFWAAYLATDRYFRIEKVPYPFEIFGVLVGAGSAAWTFGAITFVRNRVRGQKKRPQRVPARELKEITQ
jgi:hypothetical protein